MTGRHAGRTAPLEITRRDWKPPFFAVVVPSLLYAFLTVYLLTAAVHQPGERWWIHLLQLATVLGRGVIDQLGWVFGILITIQLGCLIALLGGQILARDRQEEATLRSALSDFSFLPVVALSPAITVASIAAFRVGDLRGALFVIVPALILTVALSVFIGTFEVADELTKLQQAKVDRDRAQRKIEVLKKRPHKRFVPTVIVRSVVLVLVEIVLILAGAIFSTSTMDLGAAIVLTVLLIPLSVLVLATVSAHLKPSLNSSQIATASMLLTALLVLQAILVVTLFVLGWPLGVGSLIIVLLFAVGTVRVFLEAREARADRVAAGFWRRGGGLAHSGTSVASKAAENELKSAEERIDVLKTDIDRRAQEDINASGQRRNDDGVPGDG